MEGDAEVRISKRVREEAAVLCAIAASNSWVRIPEASPDPEETGLAEYLAWTAMAAAYAVWQTRSDWTPETHWAEAEAMLRDGWRP